jgi:hypothetical protein
LGRLATAFVLGYHGCRREIAEQAVRGEIDILQSTRAFDWLGPGAYFWESDPQRAREWADWKTQRGDYDDPAVIGAVIDLGNCLDLASRRDLELVRDAYESFAQVQSLAGLPMPENRDAPDDPNEDRILRFLDCAVLRHLHEIIEAQPEAGRPIESFDTVRGMFPEGGPLFPGGRIMQKSHVQIAVRNPRCIKGVFWPRGDN